MADQHDAQVSRNGNDSDSPEKKANWKARLILVAVAVIFAGIIYLISVSLVPRWWSTTIADQSRGSITGGVIQGLSIGFLFTIIPLFVLWQVRRPSMKWKWRLVLLALAMILATPNWMTLGIFLNGTNAGRIARQKLENDADWFGGATIAGVAIAAALFLIIVISTTIWRHRGRRVQNLQDENEALESLRERRNRQKKNK